MNCSGGRGHAPSDHKANIQVSIFPNPYAFEFSKNVATMLSGGNGGMKDETKDGQRQRRHGAFKVWIRCSFFA
jgi:hypothetical protein